MRRIFALVLGLMLVASACGDDGGTDAAGAEEDLSVPDVVGESVDFARGLLEAGGFTPDIVEVVDEGVEAGTVMEQVPAAGSPSAVGATVVIKVAVAADATTTTEGATTTSGDGATTTTAGGGTTTTAGSSTTTAASTTTSATTTTLAEQLAPDDGGTGEPGESAPEYFVTVVAENNSPEAVVFIGAISVPGDRGDGISIRVDNLTTGVNARNATTQVTFVCIPGGPEVKEPPGSSFESGYGGGSDCDAAYATSFASNVDSNHQTYFIYVPDGVEGYFEYTLTLVSVRS